MMAPTLEDVPLATPLGGSFHATAVLGIPDGEGPWPGVVIVHEAFGATEVMRRQVERMTAAGYVVLMPDLYADGGARRCLVATFRALSSGHGKAFVDIETARQTLIARDDCTGSVGVLGFCLGGAFALAAASRGFDVASANYGMLPKGEDALIDACPIVGSYGGRDRSLRGVAASLETELERHGIPHDVKEYPAAGHQFLNEEPDGPKVMQFLTKRIMGAGPEPESATDAWQRIDSFFAEHLGASAA